MGSIQYMPPGRDARKTAISQELIQRVGMWSGCNVELQQFEINSTLATTFRMRCKVCLKTRPFDYEDFLNGHGLENLLEAIEQFCKKHIHVVEVVAVAAVAMPDYPNPYHDGIIKRRMRIA